jgi:heptosyltransferase-1
VKDRFVRWLVRLLSALSQIMRGRRPPPVPESVRRIVVFQMSGVGDLLLITPALRALHHLYPSARIDIVTYSLPNAGFLFRFPYVGEGCEFPLFDLELRRIGSMPFWRSLKKTIRFMRKKPIDIYISFHHTWLPQWYLLELWLAARSDARFRVGINPDYVSCQGVFDRSVPESLLDERHYRAFFMDVVGLLGNPGKDVATECPLTLQEIEEARSRVRRAMPVRDRIICLHVGATHAAQLWPIDRFQELARKLEADGYGMVLLGTRAERALTDQITSVLQTGSYLDAVGTTDLFQMAALIEVSHLFIGNDSGPLHVAIARRRPTIGLIGPGKPRYHLYEPDEAVILRNPIAMDIKDRKEAAFPWTLSVEEVYGAARKLLA